MLPVNVLKFKSYRGSIMVPIINKGHLLDSTRPRVTMSSVTPILEAIVADDADLLYVDKYLHVSTFPVSEWLKSVAPLKCEPLDRWRDRFIILEIALADVDHINVQIEPYITAVVLWSIAAQLAELLFIQAVVPCFPAGM